MDPETVVEQIARAHDAVVMRDQAMRAGLTPQDVRSLIRSGRWTRLARGAYLVNGVAEQPAPRRARKRQNRLVNAGWIVLRFTWADTMVPDYIPYVVRSALDGARARRS